MRVWGSEMLNWSVHVFNPAWLWVMNTPERRQFAGI